MKNLISLFVCLALAGAANAGVSNNTVWEVRATNGADTNGGCYNAQGGGTDYSDRNTAFLSATDLAVDSVTNTRVSSATHGNFVSSDIGNCINITAGAGFTTGIYQILSITSNKANLDRSPAAISTTGGTFAEGGAFKTLEAIISASAVCGSGCPLSSNKVFVKAEATYTPAVTLAWSIGTAPTGANPYFRVVGYTSTRSDGGQATIAPTGSGIIAFSPTGQGFALANLIIDMTSVTTTSTCVSSATSSNTYSNIKCLGWITNGITQSGGTGSIFRGVEITGGAASCTAGLTLGTTGTVYGGNVHGNQCTGIKGSGTVVNTLAYSNSGSTSDGVECTGSPCIILYSTIDSNGRYGINASTSSIGSYLWLNNTISNHTASGGGGIRSSGGAPSSRFYDGNCFYNNVNSGVNDDRITMDVTTINANLGTYTNTFDKRGSGTGATPAVTADPYTTQASADFRLNTTTAGGAQCRVAGQLGAYPGLPTPLSYVDMGAYQHQDPAAATGGTFGHPMGR